MATLEMFTVGAGEYIDHVADAVAAWMGQGGYKRSSPRMLPRFGWT